MATNSEIGLGGSSVPKNVKHQWTCAEDDYLVACLYELFMMGCWKCDTGFKSGYLHQIEKMMEERIPGCAIKASPHIESRVKTLKKQTMAIAEMFTHGSGFAWNEEKQMVECEKLVFDLWVKSHPTAKGLRNKTFPHYDTLLEIFGKDRATGKHGTTAATEEEDVNTVGPNDIPQQSMPSDGLDGMEFSSTQVEPSPTVTPTQRLRKNSDGMARGMLEMSSSIKKLVDGTMVYYEKISNAMTEESETNNQPKQVAQELQKIEGLSIIEAMNVGTFISNNSYTTAMFMSLSDEKRKEMVFEILKKL